MILAKAVQELRDDPDFCRGFRRGVGLILASFVISQCLICALYPLFVRLGTRLAIGWSMIAVGAVGMIIYLWITTTWLWYLLRRTGKPFGEWLRGVYG